MGESPTHRHPHLSPFSPSDAASRFEAATSPVLFDTLDEAPSSSAVEDLQQRWERVPRGVCVAGERWLSRAGAGQRGACNGPGHWR